MSNDLSVVQDYEATGSGGPWYGKRQCSQTNQGAVRPSPSWATDRSMRRHFGHGGTGVTTASMGVYREPATKNVCVSVRSAEAQRRGIERPRVDERPRVQKRIGERPRSPCAILHTPQSSVMPLPNGRGLGRHSPCPLRDSAPQIASAIVALVSKASHVANVAHRRRLCVSAESMHTEGARLVESLSHEPRHARSAASLRTKTRKVGKP